MGSDKWWDGIETLSGLSKTPSIISTTVNDTIPRDVDLAESMKPIL